MTLRTILHYDAFSSTPHMGNPAGVVLNADDLHQEEMQSLAEKVGFNETVFVLPSDTADLRLRYFTPGHEINLCGHATVASLFCLKSRGLLGNNKEITIETNVGILPVSFDTRGGELFIKMKQDQPRFIPFQGDVSRLAQSMSLSEEDLDISKPIVYGSTGTWTLLVPIRNLHSFSQMIPQNNMFPEILSENPKSSVHPFSFKTTDQNAMMHARHFSSPYSGTIEDPATGTASGVMGAYYLTYVNKEASSVEFIVEQGHEINRDGKIYVQAVRGESSIDVYVSGTAVFVREFLL
ncbi:PhzF family phenazine biosynthesis protein [Fontibacillus solani]|uniref:PhzF family phenazine biosynthesis protein n=1 Tax=Fontibacillus solani TaxID=1572857 RepID=A0A7W3SU06_9BACL|nr:PhzF family phenazine biosynthesis isomerase [Fontibacillus solani]MBA9086152.1 PhzF family phenazine biosynthesis protein [Fontibacillus solani]